MFTSTNRKRKQVFAKACILLFIVAGPVGAQTTAISAQIDFVVSKGRVEGGVRAFKYKRGESIMLRVTSDAADELHVHGVDKHLRLLPGKTASLEFVANRTGRFPVELHHSGLTLGTLEVYPR